MNCCHYRPHEKISATVTPHHQFDPAQDAEALHKAMKGLGTDESAIIKILTKRSNQQRIQIATQFTTLHGKNLIKELKSELSGNLKDLVVALMTPRYEFYAKELHHAISGIGTDDGVLIEVLCTLSNSEIHAVRTEYRKLYNKDLEDALRSDTSGTFKRLMTSLCNAMRNEDVRASQDAAAADVQALYKAGEKHWGTDESTFIKILCERSLPQLQLIFKEYEEHVGHEIEKAIKNEFSGDSKDCFLALIQAIKNKPAFFAKLLNKSFKGAGTKDRQLIRIIVTRCEIDMGDIQLEYAANYNETLVDAIKGDCSGDYRKCLLALIGA